MSDTAPATDIAPATISEPHEQQIRGVKYAVRTVTYPGGSIECRDLDEADQWDLAEMGGAESSDNLPWLSRAMVALSVISIDGVPVPAVTDRNGVRGVLRKLGRPGVSAGMEALAASVRQANSADTLAVAKNS